MAKFSRNRYVALLLGLLASSFGWYGLILMTNHENPSSFPTPTFDQWIGLLITVFVASFVWLKKCFTIRRAPR